MRTHTLARRARAQFVVAGGVTLGKAVSVGDGCQSRVAPGVFFAGELLDADGLTGGFNFQQAWSTGFAAGRAAAQFVLDEVRTVPHVSARRRERERERATPHDSIISFQY